MAKFSFPYSDRGFSDEEPLDSEKADQAWKEVRQFFASVPSIQPEQGFSVRWRERLELEKIRQHRRQTWMILLAIGSAAVVLLAAAGIYAVSNLEVLKLQALIAFVNVFSIVEYLFSGAKVYGSLINSTIGQVAMVLLFLMTGVATLIAVLWGVAVQQITSPGRVRA